MYRIIAEYAVRTGKRLQTVDSGCARRTLPAMNHMNAMILRINQRFLKKTAVPVYAGQILQCGALTCDVQNNDNKQWAAPRRENPDNH